MSAMGSIMGFDRMTFVSHNSFLISDNLRLIKKNICYFDVEMEAWFWRANIYLMQPLALELWANYSQVSIFSLQSRILHAYVFVK